MSRTPADRAARARRLDGLHHGLLSADALEDRVGAYPIGEFLDARNSFFTSFRHDVGRPEVLREFLAFLVPAHGDDPFGAHKFRLEHAEQADCAITDNHSG